MDRLTGHLRNEVTEDTTTVGVYQFRLVNVGSPDRAVSLNPEDLQQVMKQIDPQGRLISNPEGGEITIFADNRPFLQAISDSLFGKTPEPLQCGIPALDLYRRVFCDGTVLPGERKIWIDTQKDPLSKTDVNGQFLHEMCHMSKPDFPRTSLFSLVALPLRSAVGTITAINAARVAFDTLPMLPNSLRAGVSILAGIVAGGVTIASTDIHRLLPAERQVKKMMRSLSEIDSIVVRTT